MVLLYGLGTVLTGIVAAFVRHGEFQRRAGVPSAHLPYPLTDEGKAHGVAAVDEILRFASAEKLSVIPVIDSSNLLRAWQMASIIADGLSRNGSDTFSVEGFDVLAERSLGSAANLTLDEIDAVMAADPRFEVPPRHWKSNSDYRLPLLGAESLMDAGRRVARHVGARVVDAMKDTIRDGTDGVVKVFVGHGAAFRHAAVCMGALKVDEVQGLSMFHGRPVFLAQGGTGADWRRVGGEWKVRAAGEEALD